MFVKAIKNNSEYIKPLVNGYKLPYKDEVYSGIATVMLINDEGWVLTCKHVAENVIFADKIMTKYEDIKKELFENKIPPKKIYKKYGIGEDDIVIFRNVFLNLVDSWTGIKLYAHKTLDMCLIKFENPGKFHCSKYPVFAKENSKPGEILCRIGFPYKDIECFKYNHVIKDLVIEDGFDPYFQPFPMDGMVTRYLVDDDKKISLFEMTNPSLIGQSGGPIVNKDGYVVGLQTGNGSKDIGITIKTEIRRNTKYENVVKYPFAYFGIGINVNTIKDFLKEHNVSFKEEK